MATTKKALQSELRELGVEFKSKATKAELEELLAAAKKPARKQRVSTKAILRDLFPDVGTRHSVEDVVAHVTSLAPVKEATIGTMIGDLKNPKYAAGETINIIREGDDYVRQD